MTVTDTPTTTNSTATEPTTATLTAERDALLVQCADSARELEEFKNRVGRLAMQKAREHGWCSVVQNLLEELDVKVPTMRFGFDVLLRVHVTGTNISHYEETADFIRGSLNVYEEGAAGLMVSLDDDWEDSEIESASLAGIENISLLDD